MKEIEFRGKRINYFQPKEPPKWIYGPANCTESLALMLVKEYNIWTDVERETVGQYIGLKDDNGVKIYEGDVVDVVPILGIHFRGVVKFNNHTSAFDVFREERGDSACLKDDFSVEVRGNVFDNPEFEKYKEIYFRED